jgi:hypothetical protein
MELQSDLMQHKDRYDKQDYHRNSTTDEIKRAVQGVLEEKNINKYMEYIQEIIDITEAKTGRST